MSITDKIYLFQDAQEIKECLIEEIIAETRTSRVVKTTTVKRWDSHTEALNVCRIYEAT